jgi:hypothetical protein
MLEAGKQPAVDAGLAVRDAGGDFADRIIACDGSWLGGEIYDSFDKKATGLRLSCRLLS